jgi:poly-gamma-glutamate synthesis protein (capsule biosynthesis protein)
MRNSKIIRICFALTLVLFTYNVHKSYAQQTVTLLGGGDVNWCLKTVEPGIIRNRSTLAHIKYGGTAVRLPFINNPHSRSYLEKRYNKKTLEDPMSHWNIAIHYHLSFHSDKQKERYPFKKIVSTLRKANICFINLETPLSDSARWVGAFRTPTSFAKALRWAGVDVASVANNHAGDAGGLGMMNTLAALKNNGIKSVGGGDNLEDATKPVIIKKNGISFAFLGYTQFVNVGVSAFALPVRKAKVPTERQNFIRPARSGVAPMDPFLIKKDIKALRGKVDYIILILHGLIEDSQITYNAGKNLYKQFIDDGADIIFGAHPHVPRGIEIYKGHPIIYSTGNFIFGHNHQYWGDNYLVRFIVTKKKLKKLEILPIAGKGKDMSQPYLLKGKRAQKLLKKVNYLSKKLGTKLQIKNNIGIINL